MRLNGYDYSQAGAYFVTLVTHERSCLFGESQDGGIQLNSAGKMITHWWLELVNKFSILRLDEFVVMPNHLHGILWFADHPKSAPYLGEIIQWYKTMTTNEYIHGVKQFSWTVFHGKVWQRNYYDHIIRGEKDLDNIRLYIQNNPLRWAEDADNPIANP
jgi:REP element-mobilizing transposase RayT